MRKTFFNKKVLSPWSAFLICQSKCLTARAHGFGERYDLPVPMSWIIVRSCLVVAFTFLISVKWSDTQFLKRFDALLDINYLEVEVSHHPTLINIAMAVFSCLLLLLCFCTATWGSEDALMNFAPTFIWIIWWIGCSFCVVIFGNIWPNIDPWRSMYRFVAILFKSHSSPSINPKKSGLSNLNLKYPGSLGYWPCVLGLLTWCGLEIIYPIASMPRQLSFFIAAYSLWTWMGMLCFGLEAWCQKADVFSIYFRHLASLHYLSRRNKKSFSSNAINVSDVLTTQHLGQSSIPLSQIAFVIAMIASVLFDGLHAGPMWLTFESTLHKFNFFMTDVNGYRTGVCGLFLVWITFLIIYLGICQCTVYTSRLLFKNQKKSIASQLHSEINFLSTAYIFLKSLLPIAFAYLIAHNFSSLFIQGQNIIALASDPFGRMWNLFGTANYYPDITLVDAKMTWYVATFSIVIGHVVSVFIGHQASLTWSNLSGQVIPTNRIWILNLPMTLLMIAFTALSLSIIAEPLTLIAG